MQEQRSGELSVEWQLMLACACNQITDELISDRLIQEIPRLNVDRFLKLVRRHRVTPLVCSSLVGLRDAGVPVPIMEPLAKRQLTIARKNMRLAEELGQIAKLLHDQGIPVWPFKGPILAVDVCGGLHRRQFIDLDLLIRPGDLVPTLEVLQSLGYRNADAAVENLSGKRLRQFLKRFKSHTVIHPGGRSSVDIHWRLSEDAGLFSRSFEELISSDSSCRVGGVHFPTMPANVAVQYLAFHACKHGCTRLSWLCDFALAARKIDPHDWNSMLRELPQQTVRMIAAALIMIENLSLIGPIDQHVDQFEAWRHRLKFPTAMMMSALYSDDEKAINGANVGLLRWKLSGNIRYFVDSLFRAVLPKQDDLAKAGVLKPHLSRWNHLAKLASRGSKSRQPPKGS